MFQELALHPGYILLFNGHQDSCMIRDTVLDMSRDLECVFAKQGQGLDDLTINADEKLIMAALYNSCVNFSSRMLICSAS